MHVHHTNCMNRLVQHRFWHSDNLKGYSRPVRDESITVGVLDKPRMTTLFPSQRMVRPVSVARLDATSKGSTHCCSIRSDMSQRVFKRANTQKVSSPLYPKQ